MNRKTQNKHLKPTLLTLALLTASTNALSQSATTFVDLNYVDTASSKTLNALHFFADQEAGGTFDEFGFLNTDSSIGASIGSSNDFNAYTLFGELFVGNIILGGAYTTVDIDAVNSSEDAAQLSIGYLFDDHTIVRYRHNDIDGLNAFGEFVVEHNYQINGNDYIGFSASVDTSFDQFNLGTSYFVALGNGKFARLGADYFRASNDDTIGINARYYFSPASSLGATYNENDYSLGFKHYFTFNIALEANYIKFDDNGLSDNDTFSISLSGQF